jgi:hypothetical protein
VRFEEYRRFDAVALAGLVRKGEVSAGELLDVAIARAEAVNPKINAIVHKQYEQARATIGKGLPNGPLAGVPYLIKDLATFEVGNRRGSAAASTPISSPITTVVIRRAARAPGWSQFDAGILASARAPSRACSVPAAIRGPPSRRQGNCAKAWATRSKRPIRIWISTN